MTAPPSPAETSSMRNDAGNCAAVTGSANERFFG